MKCPNCGKFIPPTTNFCPDCSYQLVPPGLSKSKDKQSPPPQDRVINIGEFILLWIANSISAFIIGIILYLYNRKQRRKMANSEIIVTFIQFLVYALIFGITLYKNIS